MNPVRQILWKLLVVGMIPFILGAGLPQMECRCAAAKGQRYCECCFRKPGQSRPSNLPLKPCCQRQLASQDKSGTNGTQQSADVGPSAGCPTCHQFRNPKTGSCCTLKLAEAPTLSKEVNVSEFDVAPLWMPLLVCDWQAPLLTTIVLHNELTREFQRPPLDRVIVFEHFLI